ncbi:MAG: class I SAM-dependent rRNA methyltransferase [Gemmatimonadota bacterium]|nr:class I SAM-dependent rRNA methyltransferase [Gemmatimonadota bacterium]
MSAANLTRPIFSTPAIVAKRGALRIQRGHPWVFKSDMDTRPDVPAGVAPVLGVDGAPLGWALWSPLSEISLRMIERDATLRIDDTWWFSKLKEAVARRDRLAIDNTAYRLIHGEGDGLPSLVVDRYGDYLVVQLLSAGMAAWQDVIIAALQELTGCLGIVARHDVAAREREGLSRQIELLFGEVPHTVEVHEHGVRFLAAPWDGQKTGAFLDQRDNRVLVGTQARGRALDCFAYHGSFALHMAPRADEVIALDSSKAALARASENVRLNGFTNVQTHEGDAFGVMRDWHRAGQRFDTIVVDPPAFAKTRAALPAALRGYKDINLQGMKLLSENGLMFSASCSHHLSKAMFLEMLQDAATDSGRRFVLEAMTGQGVDHPEILTIPETGYLKGALLRAQD